MLECRRLSKSFAGRKVIDDLNLDIASGELVVLIGPSGCGKSTLLRMFNRLIEPDSGEVLFDGEAASAMKPAELRRRIGYVIQSTGLFPHWTVARNIGTVPRLLGWPKVQIDARVREVMAAMDMDYDLYADKHPHQLSGGQAQRIGVARALAADPDVLLMDEPFGALDPVTRSNLQHMLRSVQRHSGKTVIFVTHDMDEALMLADKIAIMHDGHIDQFADPITILTCPANDFVRDFVGQADLGLKLLDRRLVGERITVADGEGHEWQCDADGRPKQLLGGRMPGDSDALVMDGTVVVTEHTTLKEALSRMVWHRTLFLPVVDSDSGRLIGEISLNAVLARPKAHA